MPIRPEQRALYPADWKRISMSIRRDRARWACEGIPPAGPCGAINGLPHPITGAKVVLTVAHLDHDPTHNDPANLRALCQKCHNRYDAPMRAAGRKARAS
jgi:5-methylcytosine-specific restriction endonuclease McrA